MDFEILSENPRPANIIDELERLIAKRKWIWSRWTQKPPQLLAIAVLFAVALELTLSARLVENGGVSMTLLKGFGETLLIVAGVELGLAIITAQAAEIFGKSGKTGALLTFFNLSLTPLLLILPVTVVTYISGRLAAIRLLLYFILLVKVLGNWRDAMELVYKFSKMQSAIVMYVGSAVAFILLIVAAYVALFNHIVNALS